MHFTRSAGRASLPKRNAVSTASWTLGQQHEQPPRDETDNWSKTWGPGDSNPEARPCSSSRLRAGRSAGFSSLRALRLELPAQVLGHLQQLGLAQSLHEPFG